MKHEYHSPEYYAQVFRDFLQETVGRKDRRGRITQSFPATCSGGRVFLKSPSYCFSLTFKTKLERREYLEVILEEGVGGGFEKGAVKRGEKEFRVERTEKGKIARISLVSLFDWVYPHFRK